MTAISHTLNLGTEIESIYPLTPVQHGMLFHVLRDAGTGAYVSQAELTLRGELDPDLFEQAGRTLTKRHDVLRTAVAWEDLDEPLQVVHREIELPFARHDWRNVPAAEQLKRRRALCKAERGQAFDLARAPLFRVVVAQLADEVHSLVWTHSHLIVDGWSWSILFGELFAAYDAAVDGRRPEVKPVRPYRDYVAWLKRQDDPAAEAYWRAQLDGFVAATPLGVDRHETASEHDDNDEESEHILELPAEQTAELREFARRHDLTLNTVVQGAWALLLSRYSANNDIVFGVTTAGRPAELKGAESMVGLFLNTLPLRVRSDERRTLVPWLTGLQQQFVELRQHESSSLVDVQRYSDVAPGEPLFESIFVFENYPIRSRAADAAFEVEHMAVSERTSYPLSIVVVPGSSVVIKLGYQRRRFERSAIARVASHFETLLGAFPKRSDARLCDLQPLPAEERHTLLADFNDTRADYPADHTLVSLLEAQVERTPDAVVLTCEGHELSYKELNAKANQVAHTLTSLGVGPETIVAVCVERSPELVVGLLGILKAGAAYLPLDSEYPTERLRFMLEDARVALVLSTGDAGDALPETDAAVLRLDSEWSTIARSPTANPPRTAVPENLAYVIYTSGSTGKPKGVANSHRGICNRLDWMQKRYALATSDSVLQKTPISFDVSVWEFFWPLLTGARLVLAAPGGHKDAAYLRDLIAREGITTAHFVPSMLAVFLAEEGIERCESLRRVICSGEELSRATAERFFERLECELHNLYGPTEAAIDVSSWQCRPTQLQVSERVPIGHPIQNITLHICDAALELVPIGVAGELYIGGVGVARGYIERARLTAERFIPNLFAGDGSRLYRTGDLARHRPGGEIEFLGRVDSQVKVRGHRIELGEIEATLREQPNVAEAAVIARQDVADDTRLVAYVVAQHPDATPSAADLRGALKRSLPDYMVPATVVALDALPLSPNGKLDRKALPAAPSSRDLTRAAVKPRTTIETAIAEIWAEVLGVDGVGIDDSFFDLGGHSLVATKMIARLRAVTPSDRGPITVTDLFKHPTVRELAALLDLPKSEREPHRLLHELTAPIPAGERILSFICVPQGGASAVVYQPLADAIADGYSIFAVAVPGHDPGLPDEQRRPVAEVAQRCAAEIVERVEGPIALYGHCVGSALTVELARQLEAAGRKIEAIYIGGHFPSARPPGFFGRLARLARLEPLLGDRTYFTWLKGIGADLDGLGPAEAQFVVRNLRYDAERAEDYYTELLHREPVTLDAPIISVVGDRDPLSEYYQERYKDWHRLTHSAAVVVIDEAAHFFLRYRASELAEIISSVHHALEVETAGSLMADAPDRPMGWWLEDASTRETVIASPAESPGPEPSLARFLAIAALQLVSITGTAITAFALPLWIYLKTGSLGDLGLITALEFLPGVLITPLAGAITDRTSRRTIMVVSDLTAGLIQGVLAVIYLTGSLTLWHLGVALPFLSIAAAFQVLAYTSAVPQLVPKRYLGHANGTVQLAAGMARLVAPLVGAALLASVGLGGIFAIDMASFFVCVVGMLAIRFPHAMPHTRRESIASEITKGLAYTFGHRGIRAMLIYFALLNIGLASLIFLVSPLVLSFGSLSTVAHVTIAGGAGAALGGLTLGVWGGPGNRRMFGMLVASLALAASGVVTGLRPSALLVGVGVFGIFYWLSIVNGIYFTIVQVKVPQRLHGRVLALNLLVAWATIPLALAVIAPLTSNLFNPLLEPNGLLASTVGRVLGVGEGRGLGLVYVVFALLMASLTLAALRHPTFRRFDVDVPDAEPDDLLGLQEAQRKRARALTVAGPQATRDSGSEPRLGVPEVESV